MFKNYKDLNSRKVSRVVQKEQNPVLVKVLQRNKLIGCVHIYILYTWKEIYFKELSHTIMEVTSPKSVG